MTPYNDPKRWRAEQIAGPSFISHPASEFRAPRVGHWLDELATKIATPSSPSAERT